MYQPIYIFIDHFFLNFLKGDAKIQKNIFFPNYLYLENFEKNFIRSYLLFFRGYLQKHVNISIYILFWNCSFKHTLIILL